MAVATESRGGAAPKSQFDRPAFERLLRQYVEKQFPADDRRQHPTILVGIAEQAVETQDMDGTFAWCYTIALAAEKDASVRRSEAQFHSPEK